MNHRILQFGTGIFLRGFWGDLVQRMNEAGADLKISSVKLTASPEREAAAAFTSPWILRLRGWVDGEEFDQARQITCHDRYLNPFADPAAFAATALDPEIRIVVSNSTEAGLAYRPCRRDAAADFPARLADWLLRRAAAGLDAPLILPFELIEDNGRLLRDIVLAHANHWQTAPDEIDWIASRCDFRDTLVDRIVTRGEDGAITAEPYAFLAVQGVPREDLLPLSCTLLEAVWTPDIRPFRQRKVGLLNGAHTALVFPALAAGHATVLEAMQDPPLRGFLEELMRREICPALASLSGLPETDLQAYACTVLERFANPFLRHQLLAIALNSSSKFRVRLDPIARRYRELSGEDPPRLTRAHESFAAAVSSGHLDGDTLHLAGPSPRSFRDDPEELLGLHRHPETTPSGATS